VTDDGPVQFVLPVGRLRAWRLADVASVARHANNRNVSRNLRDLFPFPYTEEDAREWLATHVGRSPITNFAIEVDGEAVGSVGLRLQSDVYRRTAELGYWLAEPYWGRGIVTEAVKVVTAYAFSTFDLARIEADVFDRNARSARVLEKAGFRVEGRLRSRITKDGETMDALLYAIVASP
jgi:ribosomal-protein-alanine N-acetyltransferase